MIGSIFGTLVFKRGKIISYIFCARRSFSPAYCWVQDPNQIPPSLLITKYLSEKFCSPSIYATPQPLNSAFSDPALGWLAEGWS